MIMRVVVTNLKLITVCLFTLLLVFFQGITLKAQTPDWEWAKSLGSYWDEFGQFVSTDADGNIYVAGIFNSSNDPVWMSSGYFDAFEIGGDTLGTKGGADIFLAKYTPAGDPVWWRSLGSTGADQITALHIDANDNLFVYGNFKGEVLHIGEDTIESDNTKDKIFLTKFSSDGSLNWSKHWAGETFGGGLDTDSDGNIYISGWFSANEWDFGDSTLRRETSSSQWTEIFVAKMDSNGDELWAEKVEGGPSRDRSFSLAVDNNANIFITGYFDSSTLKFDDDIELTGGNGNKNEVYLAKYDTNGNVLWAKAASGSTHNQGRKVLTDQNGNAYLTGFFRSETIAFDTINLGLYGQNTMFLAKYAANGDVVWAKTVGEGAHMKPTLESSGIGDGSFTIDDSGNLYAVGSFIETISFGSTELTAKSAGTASTGSGDTFIAKFDNSGEALWANYAPSQYYDGANGVTVNSAGDAYITGYFFINSTDYGLGKAHPPVFGADTLVFHGNHDAFLVRIGSSAGGTTAAEQDIADNPAGFQLQQNYPNPFNPSTNIGFSLPAKAFVTLKVYDITGREVANLVSQEMAAGDYIKTWDASGFASGIYFYRLQAGSMIQTRKLTLIK